MSYRILLAANFDRSRAQGRWFNTEHKLFNGFTRLGHMVLPFSDRDAARELSPLPTKKLGISRMNARLVETAAHFRPHLILFGHADLTGAETFSRLREKVPGVRLAQFNVDPVHRAKTMADFTARAAAVDLSFITTGDSEALDPLAPRPGSICFMPNPVDPAVETARVFDAPREALDWDALFLGTGIEKRGEQLAHIAAHLPDDYRFSYGGRAKGVEPLVSLSFLEALTTGASCPNLPLDDARPTPHLYSSDRIAQLLGQGVLTYTHAPAALETLYEEGVVNWDSRDALVEEMARMRRDDAERRRRAEIGWRLAHKRTSSAIVADAILDAVMQRPASHRYAWPWEPLA